jgi:hypothetical protein
VLDRLCLYHQKGLGFHGTVKHAPVVLVVACCFAISAGLVLFPNRVPPFGSTLLCGVLMGCLVTATRYHLAFQRQWPLLKAIIDWKLANRLRREAGMLGD